MYSAPDMTVYLKCRACGKDSWDGDWEEDFEGQQNSDMMVSVFYCPKCNAKHRGEE